MSNVYKQHTPGGDSGLYLKLKDGDKFKLRICSEPALTVYKAGDKPRYAWVVWNHDLKKAQVYNAGVSVYTQIADLIDDWGDPTEFDITVKRTGSGMQDTEYSVNPTPKSEPLPQAALDEVEKVDLIQASKGKWLKDYLEDMTLPEPVSNEPRTDEVAPMPSDEDAPIDLNDIPF